MSSFIRRGALAASLAFAVSPALAAPAPAPIDLVFYASFLAKAADGSVINYRYVRQADDAKLAPSFEDDVKMRVAPEGKQDAVAIDLFTGARAVTLPNQARTGNPVILAVFDRDVKEMSKLLGGSFFYIQNRIMEALRTGDGIEPQKVEYGGKTLDGWKVTIRPFARDSHREQLREFAERSYELTFADDVPGGLYALRTVTPRPGDGKPLLVEELKLAPQDDAAKATETKQP